MQFKYFISYGKQQDMAKYNCSNIEGQCPHCNSIDTRIINKFEKIPDFYLAKKCNKCSKNFLEHFKLEYNSKSYTEIIEIPKKE